MEKIDSWSGRSGAADQRGQRFHTGPFFRGDERIREDIPVTDSLGKETFLVVIFTGSGNLKDQ